MNPDQKLPPSDEDLDRLLASRVRRTIPEFELRWRALRAELSRTRPARTARWTKWLLWPGLATAAVAALVVTLTLREPAVPAETAAFEELLALDAALTPARPLLEVETRAAVLNLPVR